MDSREESSVIDAIRENTKRHGAACPKQSKLAEVPAGAGGTDISRAACVKSYPSQLS